MSGDIVRVWGTADNIPIELHKSNGRWVCDLPPDFTDGQYAVLLNAKKLNGTVGIWTGILYMTNGVPCIRLLQEIYQLVLLPERFTLQLKECCCK